LDNHTHAQFSALHTEIIGHFLIVAAKYYTIYRALFSCDYESAVHDFLPCAFPQRFAESLANNIKVYNNRQYNESNNNFTQRIKFRVLLLTKLNLYNIVLRIQGLIV